MRPTNLAMIMASLFLISGWAGEAGSKETRGLKVVRVTQRDGKAVDLYRGSHALLIGVSDYTAGWPDLESIPGELKRLEKVLRGQGFSVTRVMNPNGRKLKQAFEKFIDRYGYEPENRLLFYYSGHGYTRKLGTRQKGYLVPSDAPNPSKDERGFARKAITMSQVQTWAREIEAKHALFLFDSCFSGTIFKTRALPIPRHITDASTKPVRQFITAGSAGEEVPARSVFLPTFIRALKGKGDLNRDGYITGTELGVYLHEKVLEYDTGQTPQFGKIRDPDLDEGDFVFTLARATPAAAKAPRPPAKFATPPGSIDADEEFWNIIKNSTDRGDFQAYLDTYPQGRFVPLVRLKLNIIERTLRAPAVKQQRPARDERYDDMFLVKAGEFEMGSEDEKPIHTVILDAYYIDNFEVTQRVYERVMGSNPSRFKHPSKPVESVTWFQAKKYCEKIGKRLPTEAEWEHAVRGGTTTDRFFEAISRTLELYNFANYCGEQCAGDSNVDESDFVVSGTAQAKSYNPNQWGLFDVYGNVAEWVSDWHGDYISGTVVAQKGLREGNEKVIRGGSWRSSASEIGSANRESEKPDERSDTVGFRCAVDAE